MEAEAPCLFFQSCYFQDYYHKKSYVYKNKMIRNIVLILNAVYTLLKILRAEATGKGYDVIHITWYKPFYVGFIKKLLGNKCPKIAMTVHDLIHEMEADENPVLRRGACDKKRMLKLADIVIVISENTKKDLKHFYPWVDDRKISVIYQGCKQETVPDQISLELPQDYVFFVGGRNGYKNFGKFLEGMGILTKTMPQLHIVCAGGGAFTKEEERKIAEEGLKDCIIQKFMSDAELVYCYAHAKCFVFPSAYEGFGLPVLEAFSYGCPVVLSNASCFPEIAGEGAVYFDWNKATDIAEKISYVCNLREGERAALIQKGYERLADFSWEKTAKKTVEAYRKACEV